MSFRPVDTRFGQQIIANYLATIESQQKGKQLELEQKRLEQERELEEKRLEQQHTYESGLLEHAQGQLELAQLGQRHDLANKYMALAAQGVPPPGGSIETPQTSTPSGSSEIGPNAPNDVGMLPISQTLGLGVNQQRVNFPPDLNLPPTVTLNPVEAAKLRGRVGAEEILPKEELELTKQQAVAQRELQVETARLVQKTLQDQLDRQSREAIAREETGRALGVAKLTQIGELQRQFLTNTSTRFDTHPITRDYNTLKLANETAQGNPSDLELLTAYHKALNPAQASSPEYALMLPTELPSLADRLGLKLSSITNAKQFIPVKMREDLKTQIQNRFKIQEGAYKNLRQSESDKLKQVGIENPEQFLTDYSKEIKQEGPKVGDEKKFPNGNIGVWDGTGWVKK